MDENNENSLFEENRRVTENIIAGIQNLENFEKNVKETVENLVFDK